MDTTSLASLSIAILVILTVQMLVITALTAHMFIRHTAQRHDEEALKAKRKQDLQWRNISAPIDATFNTRTYAQPHTREISESPSVPPHPREPVQEPPPRPRNPTPEHGFVNDGDVELATSSMYSQESGRHRANHEMPMAVDRIRSESEEYFGFVNGSSPSRFPNS